MFFFFAKHTCSGHALRKYHTFQKHKAVQSSVKFCIDIERFQEGDLVLQ